MKIICFLKGVKNSFPEIIFGGYWISGHSYVEIIQEDKNKEVLECEGCGKESVGYHNVDIIKGG